MISVILYILSLSVLNINFYTEKQTKRETEFKSRRKFTRTTAVMRCFARLTSLQKSRAQSARCSGLSHFHAHLWSHHYTHSFITCKLHLKWSGKVRQPVL